MTPERREELRKRISAIIALSRGAETLTSEQIAEFILKEIDGK